MVELEKIHIFSVFILWVGDDFRDVQNATDIWTLGILEIALLCTPKYVHQNTSICADRNFPL